MFVSSVVYPNRVKDTEQSWEEEEDRSIISSPTLSIDENNIYIHSNKLLDGLNVKIINIYAFFWKNRVKNRLKVI